MTDDIGLKRPVDRVTPAAFADIVSEYDAADRIAGGTCRLDLDDGTERRLVVAEDLPALDDDAYAEQEITELAALFADADDLLDRPVELTIPVGDVDRVVTEAEELGAITVWFETEGVAALLTQLLEELEAARDATGVAPGE